MWSPVELKRRWFPKGVRRELTKLKNGKAGDGQGGMLHLFWKDAPKDVTLEQLAEDVVAAVDYVQTVPKIDKRRIGLAGYSQGAWVAPFPG